MSDKMNYDNVPDRRPHVYTVGMDGTDQPIANVPRSCDHQVADKSSAAYAAAKDFPTGDDDLEVRVTSIVVAPKGAEIFEPGVTQITIEDCAAGEYVTLKQLHYQVEQSSIEIEPDHWPVLRRSIEWMLGQCRG
jgi:hypothetical protein